MRSFQRAALAATLAFLFVAAAAAQPAPPGTARLPKPEATAAASSHGAQSSAVAVVEPIPVHHRRPHRRRFGSRSLQAVHAANAGALAAPRPNAFLNANLIYDYELGRLYQIDTSPRFLTTIALRPGEHLVSKAAGDTVRWVLGETVQGSGDSAQTLVLVKPVRGGERTNIVLTTDQRSYLLEAVSHDQPVYTSLLSWNYPADQLREAAAAAQRRQAAEAARLAPVAESSVALGALNFAYRIEHPKQRRGPAWEPARVFDDGAKTYIQFPAALATTEAPPLFLVGPGGRAELVNYRVRGSYYVVDRLFQEAELRLGDKPQLVVRISRAGGPE